jgi:selenide,water dikinase
VEAGRRELQLLGRPPLRFDRLSLDVGAITRADGPAGIAIKPLEPFLAWGDSLADGAAPGPITVVGGGAAGVEVALALRSRLHGRAVTLQLRDCGLRLGSAAANRRAAATLAAAGIALRREEEGVAPDPSRTVRCTGSRAPGWLEASGLPCEPISGRVYTEASLRVEGHEQVFACGDCGLIRDDPRPPSGVWAVRAAPLLAENLRRSLHAADDGPAARPLRRWRPQRRALQLLGDGGALVGRPRAMALWGPLVLGPHPWLWRWKEAIDRRFMARFSAMRPMGAGAVAQTVALSPCRGCAAKLPAAPLAAALARLGPVAAAGGPGSAAPEDAVVLAPAPGGGLLLQSVDGFPALVADPWLNGRLTTLHACSDLWACGGRVDSALALVTLPRAAPALQEEWLVQCLAGVRSVLEPLGAALLGGHTLEHRQEGEELALALTINGQVPPGRFWAKGNLGGGEVLLLSRPIGSGVLFAAAMAGEARPGWIDAALEEMETSQAPLVEILAAHGCRAATDITGFGLLGHLGEMLAAAPLPLVAELDSAAVPAHAGALELLERGIASSLAPANRAALAELDSGRVVLCGPAGSAAGVGAARAAWMDLLVDPQTCGPLLAALPPEQAAAALAAIRAAGFPRAALIGRVRPAAVDTARAGRRQLDDRASGG